MSASKKSTLESLSQIRNVGPTLAAKLYDEIGVRDLQSLITAAREGKLTSLKGIGAGRQTAILESALELQASIKSAEKLVADPLVRPAGARKGERVAERLEVEPPAKPAKTEEAIVTEQPEKRKPGRPKKSEAVAKAEKAEKPAAKTVTSPEQPEKRKRGRPKKSETTARVEKSTKPAKVAKPAKAAKAVVAADAEQPVKRKPGRPKKIVAATPEAKAPKVEKAKVEPPKSEAPKAEKPKVEPPKAEAPKAEKPQPQSTYTPPQPKSTHPVVFVGKLLFKIARKLLS